MSIFTQQIRTWNTIQPGDRWAYTKNDPAIFVIPKSAKDKKTHKNSSLLNVFDLMRTNMQAAFPHDCAALSYDNCLEIEKLKRYVHGRYINYAYNRSLARRIWDAITDLLLPGISIKCSYKELVRELYRAGDITLEAQPIQPSSNDSTPTDTTICPSSNQEARDTAAAETSQLNEQAAVYSLTDDTELVDEAPQSSDELSDEPITAENMTPVDPAELLEWERFLLCETLPAETEKFVLHVTERPKASYPSAWTPEILEDIDEDRNIRYYLLVPQGSKEKKNELWNDLDIARSAALSQNQIGWQTKLGKKRIPPEKFTNIVVQHECPFPEKADDQPDPQQHIIFRHVAAFTQRCLREDKKVILIIDRAMAPAEALRGYERLAANSEGNLQIHAY